MQLSIPKILFIPMYKNFLPVSGFCVLLINFSMRKIFFCVMAFCCSMLAFSQADTSLPQRLNLFIEANSKMDLEKVLDYTYPKLFTIVPKEQILEIMKASFNNEQMSIRLDSLRADSIYPVFQTKQGSYAKILYSMKMTMHLKKQDADSSKKKENADAMLLAMKSQLGEKRVRMDGAGNIILHVSAVMVAAKDIYADDWCFVNLKDGDPITSQLFSKEIIDKLATYK